MEDALPRRPFVGALLDPRGVVTDLWPDSPAERAHLRVGDRLVAVEGVPVTTAAALVTVLGRHAHGTEVVLSVARGAETVALSLGVVPCPAETFAGARVHHGVVRVGGVRQRTILVVPHADRPVPVVVFLQGTGAQSLEDVPPTGSPLARWVARLAAAGIATLRVEGRGVGDSEGGPPSDVDLDTERAAAAAAIDVLRGSTAGIDADAIVLFGHSTGGMLAPRVAGPCRGIVAYGTWATPFTETMIASLRRQRADTPGEGLDAALLRAVIEGEVTLAAALAATPALADAPCLGGGGQILGRTPAFWRQLQRVDLAAAWRTAAVPALLLHGQDDRITTFDQHLAIARLLADAGVEARACSLAGFGHDMSGPDDGIAVQTIAFVRAVVQPGRP